MDQLEKLLSDISEAERQEALEYYESYFDDAGEEMEAAVIQELGSPGKVAAIIKADLNESNDGYAEYTERGYEDTRTREKAQMPERREAGPEDRSRGTNRRCGGNREEHEEGSYGRERRRAERGYHAEKKRNNSRLILVLILLVFAAPLIKGAVGGIFGILITIALLPFLIVFGLGAAVFGLGIGGVVSIVTGIGLCLATPAAGVLCIGVGCILIAVGIILLVLLVWVASKVLPKLFQKFTDFCYNLLHRERKDGAGV